jgi:LPS sulfotransferase NodH
MNYVIMGPQRSGTTYLGEFLQNSGLPYYNELFTPEICRRKHLWPRQHDEALNRHVVNLVSETEKAGFKIPYTADQPGVYAVLQQRLTFRVVHIIRDDLLEQAASWWYLNHAGISLARRDGTLWNTDGRQVDAPAVERLHIRPEDLAAHFETMTRMRWLVWWLYHDTHQYMEIHMADLFGPKMHEVCAFLGIPYNNANRPDHVPTPRPRAHELIENFAELKNAFSATPWARYFGE